MQVLSELYERRLGGKHTSLDLDQICEIEHACIEFRGRRTRLSLWKET